MNWRQFRLSSETSSKPNYRQIIDRYVYKTRVAFEV